MDKVFVIRHQFPISHAYAITIHKSQGLTLKNVLVDLGSSIFACGQAYVTMSRVTSLSGLNLINFDPRCIKALDSAITEYSYLRRKAFRPTLPSLFSHKHKRKSVQDRLWCTPKLTKTAQQQCADTEMTISARHGFLDSDGCSSYANSIMQCLLHSKVVCNVFRDGSLDCLVELVKSYENSTSNTLDCNAIRSQLGDVFAQPVAKDPVDYLQALSIYCPSLSSLLSHSVTVDTQCTLCNSNKSTNNVQLYIDLNIPQDCKSIKMNDLIASTQQYHSQNSTLCDSCGKPTKVRTRILDAKQFIVVKMDVWSAKANNKSVRRNTTITAVPNSFLKVNDKTFTLSSSVHVLSNKDAGISYIGIVQYKNKWVHCKNQKLSLEGWPKGAKGSYLAFYEHSNNKSKIPRTSGRKPKRKVAQLDADDAPSPKKPCSNGIMKTSTTSAASKQPHPTTLEDWGGVVAYEPPVLRTVWPQYRYCPVDVDWQSQACTMMNVRFICPFERDSGDPEQILTLPNVSTLRHIGGDGNCLFRAMSFIITGSERQHFKIRSAIMAHLTTIPHLVTGLGVDEHQNYLTYYNGGYSSVEDYLMRTDMASSGTWGTDFEMTLPAHMLDTIVYSYKAGQYWIACSPQGIDHSMPNDVNRKSIYIYYTGTHYEVVTGMVAGNS